MHLDTPLGAVELWLPEGEVLVPDPDVTEGAMLAWAPVPEYGGFSVSHGPPAGGGAEDLLAVERGFADAVQVDTDKEVLLDGQTVRELRLRVETRQGHDLLELPSGKRLETAQGVRKERLRFRFWRVGDNILRAGYRLNELAPAELRAAMDGVTESARLEVR